MSRVSRRRSADAVAWLQENPTLEQLVEQYPHDWELVQLNVGAVIERDDADEIKKYLTRVSQPEAPR